MARGIGETASSVDAFFFFGAFEAAAGDGFAAALTFMTVSRIPPFLAFPATVGGLSAAAAVDANRGDRLPTTG
jgi:uncharacterized BrkB/YihY/UPF0761 family membrane protein